MGIKDHTILRNYCLAWALFVAIMLIFEYPYYAGIETPRGPVTTYLSAVQHWSAGESLYSAFAFLYLPTSVLFFWPFSLVPDVASHILFRTFSGAVLALAVWKLAKFVSGRQWVSSLSYLTVFAFVSSWAAIRMGQFTIVLIALMILGALDLIKERHWRTTFWISLSVAFKPLALVYALMVIALHKPMRWRVPMGLAAFCALPFFTQPPAYVWESYRQWWQIMMEFSEYADASPNLSHILQVPRLFGWDPSSLTTMAIRGTAALFTLALGWIARKRWGNRQAGLALLSLSVMYVLLFSPATEGNTYALILPVAVFPFWVFFEDGRRREGIAVLAVFGLIFASYELTGGRNQELMPFLALVVYLYIAWLIGTNREPNLQAVK